MANQISFMGSLFISFYAVYACNTHILLFVSYCFILLVKYGISQSVSSLDSFCLWFQSLMTVFPRGIWQHLEACLVDMQGVEWVLLGSSG